MKSTAFRNLVLGFYACVGFFLLILNYEILQEQSKTNVTDILPNEYLLFAVPLTLPFFIGIISFFFNKKVLIFNILYFTAVSIIYFAIESLSISMIIISSGVIITTLFFLITFAYHPHFSEYNFILTTNNTVLDKFEENQSQKSYFLHIYRIFSFAFMIVGLAIIILSIQIELDVSFNEGLGVTILGFILIGFAAFLWKNPKIASYIVALICLGMFLIADFSLVTKLIMSSIGSLKSFQAILAILFWGIFVILALIVTSKTAQEEWKMK